MKNLKWKLLIFAILLLCVGVFYYVTLPAINIHSTDFWLYLLFLIAAATVLYILSKGKKELFSRGKNVNIRELFDSLKLAKIGVLFFALAAAVFIVGSVLSSPIVNAAKYQKLLSVQSGNFTSDIKEVDFRTIPLLDKSSAQLLGNRKMGSMVDMVSQFEVSDEYTQINYQNTPVRVAPLVYASGIKWFTNQKNGIPAYIRIDMATQNTECVKLSQGIKYSKSEYFNRNIYRHLRFHYPTYIFDDQIFFEIDDEGECVDYKVEDVPSWVDKVYSAELLTRLYNYYGTLKHGFFNSVLGQKDCLQATNGYNYIALEDDVWVYTGVTSVSGDQSNVGFVLMNQRTMETKYYTVEGAIEDSAMSSAEGQVQNLGYRATFPLLLNISNEPTYFMALKDGAGLVKKYAMVNVQKYQWVAIGDTVQECERAYMKLLATNGISGGGSGVYETVKGKISSIAPVVVEGNTHYYICLTNSEIIFDVNVSDTAFVDIVRYQAGDMVEFSYTLEEEGLAKVMEIKQ